MMKKILTKLFFAAAVMICFSMTAIAQQEGEKRPRPPKESTPVIEPKIKEKPKEEKPKEEKKKKPETLIFRFTAE